MNSSTLPAASSWKERYKDRICSPEAAVSRIQSGMRLYLTGNCSVPRVLLAEMVSESNRFNPPVEIQQILTVAGSDYVAKGMESHFHVNSMFISANVREAINEGRADFTPCFLSEIPRLFRKGILPLDVCLVQLSPPDAHGWCSFGIEVGVTKTAAECARIVIAEINEHMPRSLGDSFIHVSRLACMVPVDYELPQFSMGEISDTECRIGAHCAGLVEDGSTLQLGIGGIPNAVLGYLRDKKDLGIHSELFSDGVVDLVERGVITGACKTLHAGKIVAGFVMGGNKLYSFINDNPAVELHPTEYVNDPFVIARNDRMVAINSAIEVDLTGQVCADSIGTRLYSGVGGQVDFMYGVGRSQGGKPIIALGSTAHVHGYSLSRIVPTLKPGAGVITTRNHVHFVVTEHGVADLYGKSIRQRARALIDIAAPEFREDLERAARDLHYL